MLAGVIIGFVGTALLIWPAEGIRQSGVPELVPQLAILLACVSWAIATSYLRNIDSAPDPISLTGAQVFIGGIAMLLVGLARGEAEAWTWSLPGLLAMAWLTLFSARIVYRVCAWLARNAPPAVVGTYG